jgi:hypothetical protein
MCGCIMGAYYAFIGLLGGNRVACVTVCDFACIYAVWLYSRFGESVLDVDYLILL